jgi:hypothetical protein
MFKVREGFSALIRTPIYTNSMCQRTSLRATATRHLKTRVAASDGNSSFENARRCERRQLVIRKRASMGAKATRNSRKPTQLITICSGCEPQGQEARALWPQHPSEIARACRTREPRAAALRHLPRVHLDRDVQESHQEVRRDQGVGAPLLSGSQRVAFSHCFASHR